MKTTLFCALLLLTTAEAPAQWVKQRDPRVPSLGDGKPNLSAPTPRASDGKPDLSGVWVTDRAPRRPGVIAVEGDVQLPRQFLDVTADMKPEDVQLEPWAAALFKQDAQDPTNNQSAYCLPTGEPAAAEVPFPYKIAQTPRLVLVLYEENVMFRQIFLDGRKVASDAEPRWMGYSTGRWEGDTLVVETVGVNDRSRLDRIGHPHTEAMRVTERFRRRDVGHLEVDVTITDPKAYRKSLVYTRRATLTPDDDLLEYVCTENNKDVTHYQK